MQTDIISLLKKGAVGVLPTDTLYGLVGKALDKNVAERIYRLKKRAPEKPFIILISDIEDLQLFNISLSPKIKNFLRQIWPNPVSVILPTRDKSLEFLHRGTQTLAFRIPKDETLLKIIKETGPLVAPSANPASKIH